MVYLPIKSEFAETGRIFNRFVKTILKVLNRYIIAKNKYKMKQILNLILKNPLTFIFIVLVWAVYFIAYIYLHYQGINDTNQIIISIVISLCFALIIVILSCGNLFFIPGIANYMKRDATLKNTIEWLDKNMPMDNMVSSNFSAKLMAICLANFFNALICFGICYYYKLPFKLYVAISLLFIMFNFIIAVKNRSN
jgi:hypothetical protein